MINPFIIYWDINPLTCDSDVVLRISDELLETGVFVLNLRDLSSPLSDATIRVIKRLNGAPIKINLTAGNSVLRDATQGLISYKGLSGLYVEFDSAGDLRASLNRMKDLAGKGIPVGVSFPVRKHTIMETLAVVRLCMENEIGNLEIPIQRADEAEIYCPDPDTVHAQHEKLKKHLSGPVKLSVHDPFLWNMFHPEEHPNEDGCNGAKTMMYISANFDLTPCPLMPVNLGNLRTVSLKDVFSGQKRRDIRKELSSSPPECSLCAVSDKCRGGCRGRAYVLSGSLEKKDPACHIDTD